MTVCYAYKTSPPYGLARTVAPGGARSRQRPTMSRRQNVPNNSSGGLPDPPNLPSFRVEGDRPAPPAKRHEGTGLVRHDVRLEEARIDSDAAKVVRRLEREGYEAYLVGGCVRDLLLGGTPKDFDVATSARPEDVRALFRNCRVIGRRFRLAHVLFAQGKVVEVATFRKKPVEVSDDEADSELLIRNDNVFGEAHEDALRRDFTINALFYDLSHGQVLDWCGGMADIQARRIETIGDPVVRFREDPVRILRAIKFAARLDLGIAPGVVDAMVATREELEKAAKPRLFEELLRYFRGGAAARAFWLLWEMGALTILLPELSTFLDDDDANGAAGERYFARLRALDAMTKERKSIDDLVYSTAMLYEPLLEAVAGSDDVLADAGDFLEPVIRRLSMPRRVADGVRRLLAIMPRMAEGRLGRFARTELAMPAVDLREAELLSRGESTEKIRAMRRVVQESRVREPGERGPRPRAPHTSPRS